MTSIVHRWRDGACCPAARSALETRRLAALSVAATILVLVALGSRPASAHVPPPPDWTPSATLGLESLRIPAGGVRSEPPPKRRPVRRRSLRNRVRARPAAVPSSPATAHMASSWCAGDSARSIDDTEHAVSNLPDVKVLYVYRRGEPNHFKHYANEIQRSMKGINEIAATAPGSSRMVRFDMGTPCGPQYVDVQSVELEESSYSSGDFWRGFIEIVPELRRRGVIEEGRARHYLIYAQNMFTGESVGTAAPVGDTQPGQANNHNQGGKAGFVWCMGDYDGGGDGVGAQCQNYPEYSRVHVPMHELWHVLGAVGYDSPHSSRDGGHCWDEYDILCGQYSGPLTYPCTTHEGDTTGAYGTGQENLELDCGDDDYWKPVGTLMSRDPDGPAQPYPIWNTYDSRFLCARSRCANSAPNAAISAVPTSVKVGQRIDLSAAGSSDDDGIVRYEWDLDGNGSFEAQTGSTPAASATPPAPGTYDLKVRVIDSDLVGRSASVRVEVAPADPPPSGPSNPPSGPSNPPSDPSNPPSGPSSPSDPGQPQGPPSLTALVLRPSSFRAARAGPSIGRSGTLVSYTLTAPATVTFSVDRALAGRRIGNRCVAPTRANRRGRPCPLWKRLSGTFAHAGDTGANSLRFTGRIRGKKLGPGRHRLVATLAGNGPSARSAEFIVKR